MPPTKKSASDSSFTVDDVANRSKDVLKKIEKRRESWEWWEFVCVFKDRTGIIAGAFLKENKNVLGLVIFGDGATWNDVVSATTSLAVKSETKAKSILSQLDVLSAKGTREKTQEESGMSFRLLRFGDGQKLFRIKPLQYERAEKKGGSRAVIAVAIPSDGSPTLGPSITTFKKRFDKWVGEHAKTAGIAKPKEASQRGSLAFAFAGQTSLMVFAPTKQVSQVDLTGTTKGAAEFWFCLEATLVALNPKMKQAEVDKILKKIGKRKGNTLPKEQMEHDDGKMNISYVRHQDICILQIWPSFKDMFPDFEDEE